VEEGGKNYQSVYTARMHEFLPQRRI